MKKMTNKPKTRKGRPKKQPIFASGSIAQRPPGGGKTGADISKIRVSQTVRPKHAIIRHADLRKAMKARAAKEIERNKNMSDASFYFAANAKLAELLRRAEKGDVDAARMLLGYLSYNVCELEKFCSSKAGIAKQMVVIGESWPLLHTGLKPNKDGALTIPPDHFLRKLGVVRGKRHYSTETIGTAIADTLYKQMEFYRHSGPQTLWDKSEKTSKSFTTVFASSYPCRPRITPIGGNARSRCLSGSGAKNSKTIQISKLGIMLLMRH